METVRKKKKTPVFVLTAILVTIAGGLLGTLTMVDYYGIGVLTVFIFYFFRGRKWWCLLGQIAALYWVNVELLGGLMYPVRLFGMEFELCQRGLALLALVPIWLYRGRQGYHSKPFQYFCYAFYPVHAHSGADTGLCEPVICLMLTGQENIFNLLSPGG